MKINLGKFDIATRFVIGLSSIVVGGYMAFAMNNIYGLALAFTGGILTITGLMKWCPMYAIFGLRSCPLDATERR
jgi:hypothetical protein